jgi:PST family polysaccharide transporter
VLTLSCVALLARLLGPSAYGLMAMANVVMMFLLNFRDLGTAAAVIQRPTVSDRLLSSLFWLNCGIGVVLCSVVFGSSWGAAAFFHEPRLKQLLQVLAISFFVTSAGVVHNALLTRNMSFKSLAVVDIASAAGGYAIAIPFALAGFGVWSLVFSNLANSLIATVLYWRFGRWAPKFQFDSAEIRSIGKFSLNLSGFGAVNYFARNADNIVVGRFLGKDGLGFYQMAYTLMLYPVQNISSVMGQVLLPAFSRIQDDNERFRSAYLKSCMLTGLITFPVILGMCAVADPLIRLILGAKWIPAISTFQILAPVGMMQSIQTGVGHIYVAKGRTDWMFRWAIGSTPVLVACFLVGARYGVSGVATAYACVYLGILMVPGFLIPFRLIDLPFREFARRMWPQTAIALVMAIACIGWLRGAQWLHVSNLWIELITTSTLGACVYILLMIKIQPEAVLCLQETLHGRPADLLGKALRMAGRSLRS